MNNSEDDAFFTQYDNEVDKNAHEVLQLFMEFENQIQE